MADSPHNPLIIPNAEQSRFAGVIMGLGDIALDTTAGVLRVGDGETPGGLVFYRDGTIDDLVEATVDAVRASEAAQAALAGAQSDLAKRLRVDTAAQGLTPVEKMNAATNIGLERVNNTNDAEKPVSTAVAAAIAMLAPKASPAFTGIPTVPTAPTATNTDQAASTAFVKAAVALLVAAAPGTLDTLKELADALGSDPAFATTVSTALANRVRTDTSAQALTLAQQANARTNIDTRATSDITFRDLASVRTTGILSATQVINTRAYSITSASRRGGARYLRSAASFLTSYSFLGTTTAGSATVTTTLSDLHVVIGGPISGAGIPAGTTVISRDGDNFVLSQPATADGLTTFTGPPHAGYVQSLDGALWVLAEDEPNLWMFGAKEGSGNADAIQAAFDFLYAGGAGQMVIPACSYSAYFEFNKDVRMLASGVVLRGVGALRSRLLCVNGARLCLGRAVIAGYDTSGKLKEGGTKADNVLLEKFAVKSFNGSGEHILGDFCDHVAYRNLDVGLLTGDGTTVSTGWKCNWTQWHTWDNCVASVNGVVIDYNMPASTTENEDHFSIVNCNFYLSKVRNPNFMPCIFQFTAGMGQGLPQTADITNGSSTINFAAAPVKSDGSALGGGFFGIDGPGIPDGCMVFVSGTVGSLYLAQGTITMNPAASPNATATTVGATVNLRVKRNAPIYQLDIVNTHMISAMTGGDNDQSGGIRIVNSFNDSIMFRSANVSGSWFENVDYPWDAYRFTRFDQTHISFDSVRFLAGRGTVFHGWAASTVSWKDIDVVQCATVLDGPTVYASGRNRMTQITALSVQPLNRIRMASKGPIGSSVDGVRLMGAGSIAPAAGATSMAIPAFNMSMLPTILQASPSFDHGGWWFGPPTLTGAGTTGAGQIAVTLNWKNPSPAGATIGWIAETADA